MRARAPLALRRKGEEGGRARLSVDETGRTLRARRNKLDRRSGEGDGHPAASTRSNFALRLEHKLQTVVDGRAWRSRDSLLDAHGIGEAAPTAEPAVGTRAARQAPAALFLKGIGVSSSRIRRPVVGAGAERNRPQQPRVSVWGHRGGRARCPDGTQPEPLTVSPPFLRPRTGNWQAGRGICRVAAVLRQPGGELPTAHI
jgi:hypothetical protein